MSYWNISGAQNIPNMNYLKKSLEQMQLLIVGIFQRFQLGGRHFLYPPSRRLLVFQIVVLLIYAREWLMLS